MNKYAEEPFAEIINNLIQGQIPTFEEIQLFSNYFNAHGVDVTGKFPQIVSLTPLALHKLKTENPELLNELINLIDNPNPQKQTSVPKTPPAKHWNKENTPSEILNLFPSKPTTDDLIDLYIFNKKYDSSVIATYLETQTSN